MSGRSGPLWAVSFAAVTFAGCLGEPAAPDYLAGSFDVPVPEWQPGYSWTYHVSESSTYAVSDSRGVDQSADDAKAPFEETVTVFNTTKDVLGSPVYFAMISKKGGRESPDDEVPPPRNPYSPTGRHEVGVFRKADLARFGSGWLYLTLTVPSTASTSEPYAYYDDRYMMNYNVLAVGTEELDLPQFQFPLREGASWNPSTGDDPAPLEYGARVMGQQELDLDGDVVRAVHVRVVGAIPPELEDDYLNEFSPSSKYSKYVESGEADLVFTGDYWWGVDQLNLVKSLEVLEVDYKWEGRRPSGQAYEASGHASQRVERVLVGHSLRAWAQEQRVPIYTLNGKNDPALDAALNADISYVGAGNLDVGAGPAPVQFYLSGGHGDFYCPHENEPWAGCAVAALDLDEQRFRTSWILRTSWSPAAPPPVAAGDTFTQTFYEPGVYVVRAEIYDQDYDAVVRAVEAYVSVGWTQEALREQAPGAVVVAAPEAVVRMMEIPVPQPGAFVQVAHRVQPDAAGSTSVDHGNFYYELPDGTRSEDFGDDGFLSFYAAQAGSYRLFWKRDLPVWAGDDPWARAQVTYNFHDYVGV